MSEGKANLSRPGSATVATQSQQRDCCVNRATTAQRKTHGCGAAAQANLGFVLGAHLVDQLVASPDLNLRARVPAHLSYRPSLPIPSTARFAAAPASRAHGEHQFRGRILWP